MGRSFRYIVILVLFALGTGLAAVAGWRYARTSAPVNGPIILISIDALRADHLPAYGYRGVQTPHIDALAADGVVFERAYAHAPLTLPAHAALLSGRLPIDTGVRDNVGFAIPDTERLIGAMLSVRGYATAAVVSSFALRKDTGIGQGFSFFDDELLERDVRVPRAGQARRSRFRAHCRALAQHGRHVARVPVSAPRRTARALCAAAAIRPLVQSV